MENEASQDADDEHFDLLSFALFVFGKIMNNVVALIGDNAATNRVFARKVRLLYISYYSHRFNLAFHAIILEHE